MERKEPMIQSGISQRTVNHHLTVFWNTLGDKRDYSYGNQIATWIGRNEKVLNKLTAGDAVREIMSEFPDVVAVDDRHANGPVARATR